MKKNLATSSLLILLLALAGGQAMAQTEANAVANWGPPTYGTPVDHYILELSTDEGDWVQVASTSSTQQDLTLAEGHTYRIRVAGVDAAGHQGPYGLPSSSYAPEDLTSGPGKPGTPYLTGK